MRGYCMQFRLRMGGTVSSLGQLRVGAPRPIPHERTKFMPYATLIGLPGNQLPFGGVIKRHRQLSRRLQVRDFLPASAPFTSSRVDSGLHT
jgi:hypothetical protein